MLVRHFPEWLPGMGFKTTAREWHAAVEEIVERPYAFVQQEMVRDFLIAKEMK